MFLFMQVKPTWASSPSLTQIVTEPLGVVLIVSAWNYPFSKYLHLFCALHILLYIGKLTIHAKKIKLSIVHFNLDVKK